MMAKKLCSQTQFPEKLIYLKIIITLVESAQKFYMLL